MAQNPAGAIEWGSRGGASGPPERTFRGARVPESSDRCRICHASALAALRAVRSPYLAKSYTLYECRSCRSQIFDLHEHGPVDLAAFYDDRFASENPQPAAFQPSAYWRGEVEQIRRLRKREPRSILDVGCRTGDFLLHWPESIARCGIELSARSAAIARTRGLEIRQEPLETARLDRRFDVVACYAILEHLSDPAPFLDRLPGLVRDDGILAIMIPSHETLKARLLTRLGVRWHHYEPPEHVSLYSRRFLDAYFRSRGLVPAARKYTSGGMLNPFRGIRLLDGAFARGMEWVDASPLNRWPVFDHLYSYYVKG